MSRLRVLLVIVVVVSAAIPAAHSQTVTGQISGRIVDPQGAIIPGANVQLASDLSGQVREFVSGPNGAFYFTNLVPGNYSIKIAQPGFKTYEQKAISVSAQERVDLHDIKMQLGEVSTTVTVEADKVHVATDSSDRTISISRLELDDTMTRGGNFKNLIRGLPGVQNLGTSDSRGWGNNPPTINGGRTNQTLITLDGVTSQDSGYAAGGGYLSPSVEAIGEVKVLTSNYNAEYGARSGGQINYSIRNGSSEFHGSGAFYYRNEGLNANEWFNNRTGTKRPRYRYENVVATIGGPILIPGTGFNQGRNKLFFFFSYDYLHNNGFTNPNRYTMPTALERAGDFSQTVTTTGALIPINDPSTGKQFPGNVIPSSRWSSTGQAMMNLFPAPNTTDPTGQRQYNFESINPTDQPRSDIIVRVDYPISPKATLYGRFLRDWQSQGPYGGILGPSGGGWRQFPHQYAVASSGYVATLIYSFRPNLTNETVYGVNIAHQMVEQMDDAMYANSLLPLKDASGQPVPLIHFYDGNYMNLRPNVNFGFPSGFSAQSSGQGVPSAPGYGFDSRWPFDGTDKVHNVTNNLTWIKGPHQVKAGFYYEKMARNVSIYSVYNTAGTYYFGSDRASPYDTGYPFSNLLTGGIWSYGEDNLKQVNPARYSQVEWFAQDTWKVHRRLTLDLGMRFVWLGALHAEDRTLSMFDNKAFDAAKAGQLLFPTLVNGQKMSINKTTGKTYPYVLQGAFDPASYTTTPFSGMIDMQNNYWHTPPVQFGPRVGFSADLFGNGKTALRGGWGLFYGRGHTVDDVGATGVGIGPQAAPPRFKAPIFINTSFTDLAGAQPLYTPQTVVAGPLDFPPSRTYNWSFGLQQEIAGKLIFEITYVGNNSHFYHRGNNYDANAVPPLTTWTPATGAVKAYLDPTSSGGGTGAFYSSNLIRSMLGYPYGAINTATYKSNGHYNALQTQVSRRFSRDLQFSVNYTWSKTTTYSPQQFVPDWLTKSVTNRPHVVNANFGYSLPKASSHWNNLFSKLVLDGWRLNGMASLWSGNPYNVSCSMTAAPIGYWTGTPTGGLPFRCQQIGDLMLPEGTAPPAGTDVRLWVPYDKASFVKPPIDSLGIGNTPPVLAYGPGLFNLDLSVTKSFPIKGESKSLEFKIDSYNVFNHFNPNTANSSLTLNFNTGVNTNAQFGMITGTQLASRRVIASLRFRF